MSNGHSESETTQGGRNSRKKTREFDDSLDDQFDIGDDGRPKTRRVNPQRLAIRLGPDLVAEMEALIVPGAKMPTFAVRKDFQERYSVDRRHIYDYFHSRGLRVAKEDKHTNLIRGRAMRAAAAAAQAQAASAAGSVSPTANHIASGSATATASFETSLETQHATPTSNALQGLSTSMREPLRKPTRPKIMGKILKKKRIERLPARRIFLAPHDPEASSSWSTSDDLPSAMAPPRHSSAVIVRRNHTVPEIFGYGNSSDTSLTREPTPGPSFFVSPDGPAQLASTSLSNSSLLDSSPVLLQDEYMNLDIESPIDNNLDLTLEDQTLSAQERSEMYMRVSNSLQFTPLAVESAGTYASYMKERTFFPLHLTGLTLGMSSARPGKDLPAHSGNPGLSHRFNGDMTTDPLDIRTWLSEEIISEDTCGPQSYSTSHLAQSASNRAPLISRCMNDGSMQSQRPH